jgi:ankyrin repeat protein
MKFLKQFNDFLINEELNILKGPTDIETEEVFNEFSDPELQLWWSITNDLPEYIKKSLKNGAELESRTEYGETPLILAADFNKLNAIKTLVEAGADLDACDKYGNSAIMIAAQYGYLEVVKYLYESGAKINIVNNNGFGISYLSSEKTFDYIQTIK